MMAAYRGRPVVVVEPTGCGCADCAHRELVGIRYAEPKPDRPSDAWTIYVPATAVAT